MFGTPSYLLYEGHRNIIFVVVLLLSIEMIVCISPLDVYTLDVSIHTLNSVSSATHESIQCLVHLCIFS